MMTTVDHLVHEATRSAVATTFLPTRYPYTYAADFLRQRPYVIPADAGPVPANMSRHEAEQVCRRWAAVEGRGEEELATVLTDAYLRVHGVERKPSPVTSTTVLVRAVRADLADVARRLDVAQRETEPDRRQQMAILDALRLIGQARNALAPAAVDR